MVRKFTFKRSQAAAPLISLALLGGALADNALFHQPAGDPAAYHQRVRAAVAAAPMQVGPWTGVDTTVAPSAVALLHPNVILARKYRNTENGAIVDVLLVHCSDARDIVGHYPPQCYPGMGYAIDSVIERDWVVNGQTVPGKEYQFSRNVGASHLTVDNFMVLPDGRTGRDMESVIQTAKDRRKRQFGAAQVQVVFPEGVTPAERDATVATFVQALRGAIDAIEAGVQP